MKVDLIVALIFTALLTGCAPLASNRTYSSSALSTATRTIEAEIVSKRLVQVNANSGVGQAAGGAIGAIGGSALGGSSTRGNLAGAVVGAIAGAVVGTAVDSAANTIDAYEYIVRSDAAGLLTIIQSDGEFSKGQKVFLILGSKPVIVSAQ